MILTAINRPKGLLYLSMCLPRVAYNIGDDNNTMSFDEEIGIRLTTPSKDTQDNLKFYAFLQSKGVLMEFIENIMKYNVMSFDSYGNVLGRAFPREKATDNIDWGEIAFQSYHHMRINRSVEP